MEALLDKLLLNEKEYNLGPDVWTTDKVRFEDLFPEELPEHLHDKHNHLHTSDAEKQEGWEDCLDEDDDA
jgi:hypothetical protein